MFDTMKEHINDNGRTRRSGEDNVVAVVKMAGFIIVSESSSPQIAELASLGL